MMKNIGLLILSIGVALAAAFGAKFSPEVFENKTIEGQAMYHSSKANKLFGAYCAALKAADQPAYVGCPDFVKTDAPQAAEAVAVESTPPTTPPTMQEVIAAEKAKHAAAMAEVVAGGAEVSAARSAWLDAWASKIEPEAKNNHPVNPSLGTLLGSWWGAGGYGFALGLVLLIVGAFIMRSADAAAMEAAMKGTSGSGDGGDAVDFGVLLTRLTDEVDSLVEAFNEDTSAEILQTKIESIQLEGFTRLIDARHQLRARYGIAGFAEVFGPMSTAERRINRSWSALIDEHRPEAKRSVEGAAPELKRAAEALEKLAAAA